MIGKSLRQRIGWDPYLKPFLFKKLPEGTGWTATLGTLSALLFGLMAVTGIFLAMFYNPSPDKAYQSIDFIMNDVPLGSILRGLHHWGAGAMVLTVFVHLLTNFFSGNYKAPRDLTWVAGVCLLLTTLGLGFTGYLLPWDMKAFWATVVSSNIPRDIPVVGEFITRMVLGGPTVSGLTLTRFYAIHMLLLPAMMGVFVVVHIYLVRIHGLNEQPGTDPANECAQHSYRFFPEHLLRSSIVFAVVLLVLIGLSIFGSVPREQIAGTLVDSYLPRPEWYYMWLFQLLTYFSGRWETVGSLAIPVLGCVFLFALPFLGRHKALGVANRPIPVAVGTTAVIGVLYLSLMGFSGAKPYGQIVPVAGRTLSAQEQAGLFIFVDRECAYCHQIQGRGGHRTGPDLANMIKKGRKADYLARYFKDPQAVASTSIMPKYDLPEKDRMALAAFVLSLDFSRYDMKILKRDQILKEAAAVRAQGLHSSNHAGANGKDLSEEVTLR